MSTIKVDTIKNKGTSAINLPNNFKVGGNSILQGYTSSGSEPGSPSTGDFWWDSSNNKLYRYINSEFKELSIAAAAGIAWGGARGLWFGGGTDSGRVNVIQYAAIATPANTQDFGDLTIPREFMPSCSNGSRAITCGGYTDSNYSGGTAAQNVIDYVTTSTTGNAADFGDLLAADRLNAACSDGAANTDRGLIVGGYQTSHENRIQYVTISNGGNATDAGNLTTDRRYTVGASDATYGVFMGGISSSGAGGTDEVATIDYVTIASTANAQDFGDLLQITRQGAASSDTTRIIHSGGYMSNTAATNIIQYLTTQTPGNATDFGDATVTVERAGACSDGTYHVNGGGYDNVSGNGPRYNNMDYVTIQTLGNAQDFGDLLSATTFPGSASGAAA